MKKKPVPNGKATSFIPLIIFGAVFAAAVGLSMRQSAGEIPAPNNTNQPTAQPSVMAQQLPAQIPATAPTVTTDQIVTPSPVPSISAATSSNANMSANIIAPATTTNINNPTMNAPTSKFNGRIICPCDEGNTLIGGMRKDPTDAGSEYIQLNVERRFVKGQPVYIDRTSQRGAWFYVETKDGREGWMHGNNLEFIDSLPK